MSIKVLVIMISYRVFLGGELRGVFREGVVELALGLFCGLVLGVVDLSCGLNRYLKTVDMHDVVLTASDLFS